MEVVQTDKESVSVRFTLPLDGMTFAPVRCPCQFDLFWTSVLWEKEQNTRVSAPRLQSYAAVLTGLMCLHLSLTFSMVSPMLLTLWLLYALFPDCLWLILTLSCELSTLPTETERHPSPGALIFHPLGGNIPTDLCGAFLRVILFLTDSSFLTVPVSTLSYTVLYSRTPVHVK